MDFLGNKVIGNYVQSQTNLTQKYSFIPANDKYYTKKCNQHLLRVNPTVQNISLTIPSSIYSSEHKQGTILLCLKFNRVFTFTTHVKL